MWRIKQIFDGEYGCEERPDGEKARCVVTLENERGERRELSVYDDWLKESIWKRDRNGRRNFSIFVMKKDSQPEKLWNEVMRMPKGFVIEPPMYGLSVW